MEEKTGKEWGEFFGTRAINSCIPVSGSIELTMRCNLMCRHCYIPHDKDIKELSTAKIIDILKELVKEGCLWLLITGGEPLLREDFARIYLEAKNMGLMLTLFTNGTLLNREMVNLFSAYPPSLVEITLYGRTKETYEKITGVAGSFEKCIRGIELLRERGIRLSLKTMVMNLNRGELKEMKDFSHSLGLDFRYDAELNPGLDGNKNPCELRLSPEEVVRLDVEDEERFKELKRFYETSLIESGFENLYICSAGKTYFHIDPYGKLSACLMARKPFYDLKNVSFKEAWKSLVRDLEEKKPTSDYRCGNCRLFSLCGQCPGWADMENNGEEKPIEYLCEITHLRAKVLKNETSTA